MKAKFNNTWFVYQSWTDDRLYAKGLTAKEATEKQAELDRLIESGACGDGCAVCGNLTNPTNRWLCERLGILDEFYTIQQMLADGFTFED